MFDRLRNEVVQINCVRKFVDNKTYRYLCDEIENLKKRKWTCSKCKKFLNEESAQCECCLDRFHENCVKLISNFCPDCNKQ